MTNNSKPKSPAPPINAKRSPVAESTPKTTKKHSVYDEIAERRRREGTHTEPIRPPAAEEDDVKIYSPEEVEDGVKIFSRKDKKAPKPIAREPEYIPDDGENFDIEPPPPKDRTKGFWILTITVLSVLCAGTLVFYLYANGVFDRIIDML